MSDTLGQLLREAREARGETLDDVERTTRIRAKHLSALEADNYAALPSPAQARGFVKNYAQHLELDVQEALGRYEAGPRPSARSKPVGRSESRTAPSATNPPGRAGAPSKPRAGVTQRPSPAKRAPQVRTRRPRLLTIDVLVAVVVTLLLVALLVWGGSRLAVGLAVTITPTAGFGAGLSTVQPAPTGTATAEATATVDLPTPAASYTGVNVTVRAELRSWVSVKVDGAEAYSGLMPPGEARAFVGQGVVEVVTANGKGTRVIYNGVDQGLMGQLGQVVDRLWTLQGMVIPSATVTLTPSLTPSSTPAR